MKHVLVPVFTDEDAKALPVLAEYLKAQSPLTVVLLHNPSVGINSDNAASLIDKNIADIEKAKADAITREDFAAADKYKRQIEEEKVKRGDALRAGWKSMQETERNKVYDQMIQPVALALSPSTRVTAICLPENEETDNIYMALARFGRSWPASLPHGQHSIVWPRSVDATKTPALSAPQPDSSAPRVETAKPAPKPQKTVSKEPSTPEEWREHLKRYFSMKKKAAELGIPMDGRKGSDVIEDIIAKMFGAVAA